MSFPDEKRAKRFCALVDSHGPERALEQFARLTLRVSEAMVTRLTATHC
jgi:hypothetical protein